MAILALLRHQALAGADGELTTMTVIAISQYQAERDMEVTGEATQELAETITAELRQ